MRYSIGESQGHQLNALPDQWYSGIVQPIIEELDTFDQIEVYSTVDSTQLKAETSTRWEQNSF